MKKVELSIHVPGTKLGEGPIWNHLTHQLLWIDIHRGLLHTYDPKTQQNTTIAIGQQIGCAVPCRDSSELLMGLYHGFAFYNPNTKELKPIVDPESHLLTNRFNDGKCDPAGRFWAGTMQMKPPREAVGSLYCLDMDLTIEKKVSGIKVSNGLAWTAKADKMFYIDTRQVKIMSFDYDIGTGHIENQQNFVTFEDEYPDGMCIDENDNLWVAFYLGGKVVCFDSRTGKRLEEIKVPALLTTSCTFGGENLDTLYITSAARKEDELGGAIFSVQPGVRGRKASFFKQNKK